MVKDTSFVLKNESTKDLLVLGNNISFYKNFILKENRDSEDDIEITNDDKDVLDIDAFIKLSKTIYNSSYFKSHKT